MKSRNLDATRRSMLKTMGMVAAGLAMGVPHRANATTPLAVALDWVADVEFAGFFVALERGYFSDQGLDVSFYPGGPNAPDPLVSLSAGRSQISQSLWLPYLDARSQGNDFVIVGASLPVNPGAVISLPSNPIRTPKDMIGKNFLIQFPSLEVELQGIAKVNGLSPDFRTSPTGFAADPLFAGDGDGYLAFITNQPLALEANGMVPEQDFIVTRLVDLGYPVATSLLTVDRQFLNAHRNELKAFLAALIKGWRDAANDVEGAATLVVEKYGRDLGLDQANQVAVLKETLKLIKHPENKIPFYLPEKQREDMIAFAKASGQPSVPLVNDVFDMSLLEEAASAL